MVNVSPTIQKSGCYGVLHLPAQLLLLSLEKILLADIDKCRAPLKRDNGISFPPDPRHTPICEPLSLQTVGMGVHGVKVLAIKNPLYVQTPHSLYSEGRKATLGMTGVL